MRKEIYKHTGRGQGYITRKTFINNMKKDPNYLKNVSFEGVAFNNTTKEILTLAQLKKNMRTNKRKISDYVLPVNTFYNPLNNRFVKLRTVRELVGEEKNKKGKFTGYIFKSVVKMPKNKVINKNFLVDKETTSYMLNIEMDRFEIIEEYENKEEMNEDKKQFIKTDKNINFLTLEKDDSQILFYKSQLENVFIEQGNPEKLYLKVLYKPNYLINKEIVKFSDIEKKISRQFEKAEEGLYPIFIYKPSVNVVITALKNDNVLFENKLMFQQMDFMTNINYGLTTQKVKNHGKCVYDAIIKQYKPFIKKLNENKLMDIFGKKNIYSGVSINDIIKFSNHYNINMYAVDLFNGKIKYNIQEKPNKHFQSLIFKYNNNHIEIINDNKQRHTITHSTEDIKKSNEIFNISDDVEIKKTDKKKQSKQQVEKIEKIEYVKTNDLTETIKQLYKDERLKNYDIRTHQGRISEIKLYNEKLAILANENMKENKENIEKLGLLFYNQNETNTALYIIKKLGENKKSKLNSETQNIFETIDKRAVNETYAIPENINNLKTYDIVKCYKNALYYNTKNWAIYSIFDTPEIYTGQKLQTGFYYTITDHFKGNSWYSMPIIEYMEKKKYKFNITHQLIPSETLPYNYFKSFINYIKDNKLKNAKLIINAFIGYMRKGVKNDIIERAIILSNYDDLISYIIKYKNFEFNQLDNGLYKFTDKKIMKSLNTNMPIYAQIIDNYYINLDILTCKMMNSTSKLIMIKTDAVCVENGNKIDCGYKYRVEKNPLKQKKEFYEIVNGKNKRGNCSEEQEKMLNEKIQKTQEMKEKRRTNKYILNNPIVEITQLKKYYEYYECDNFLGNLFDTPQETTNKTVDEIITGSCCIIGDAGTGKTVLIKNICDRLDKDNKKYLLLGAYNSVCSNLVNVMPHNKNKISTIHKLFNISDDKATAHTIDIINKVNYLIIDEISLITGKLWNLLYTIKQMCPKLRFIGVGDFRQCKPIEKIERDYFNNYAIINDIFKLNVYKCCYNWRAEKDPEFIKMLEEENIEKFPIDILQNKKDNKCDINLCYTNRTRKIVNNKIMKNKIKHMKKSDYLKLPYKDIKILREPNETYDKFNSRYQMVNYQSTMYLTQNMPVICFKKNKKIELFKNEQLNIFNWCDEFIYLNGRTDLLKMTHKEFMEHITVAYCFTVHKSQGCTYSENYKIYEISTIQQDKNLLYTALSRGKNTNNLYID